MTEFDFTIVTPSYNQGQYLANTIKSVCGQKGDYSLQYIVADGGSIDQSRKIIQDFEQRFKSGKVKVKCQKFEFCWWSKPDGGQTAALKTAFRQSKGRILGWLNSDDIFATPGTLQAVASAFRFYKPEIIFGNAAAIDKFGERKRIAYAVNKIPQGFITVSTLDQLLHHPTFSQPTTFFRRSLFKQLRLDSDLSYTMDWDLLIQAVRRKSRFYKLDSLLALERIHDKAKTVQNRREMYIEMAKLYRKHHLWHGEHLSVLKKVILGLNK